MTAGVGGSLSHPATPDPTPGLPPYAIEALRARVYRGGTIQLGTLLAVERGYTKRRATWPSQGGTMTGVIDVPVGAGPFPVVVVNHGYVAPSQYYIGEDSAKYADDFSAHGYLTVAPDYPGYTGSSPPEPDLLPIEAAAVSDMDLIGALASVPVADRSRVAVAGHSNGGGVSELVMVIDRRVRAVALYAPVSTDMADNARKWWVTSGSTGPLGSPDANPAGYALISPRGYLSGAGPPVLIMQGTADQEIPAAWTQATLAALHDVGVPVQFVSFPGAQHILAGADLARANVLAINWLDQSLAPRTPPVSGSRS